MSARCVPAAVDGPQTAGYNVVATANASRVYETTTIFFTPGGDGNEDAGNQVANTFGFEVVLATPDEVSLSDSVRIHVVVGESTSADDISVEAPATDEPTDDATPTDEATPTNESTDG